MLLSLEMSMLLCAVMHMLHASWRATAASILGSARALLRNGGVRTVCAHSMGRGGSAAVPVAHCHTASEPQLGEHSSREGQARAAHELPIFFLKVHTKQSPRPCIHPSPPTRNGLFNAAAVRRHIGWSYAAETALCDVREAEPSVTSRSG